MDVPSAGTLANPYRTLGINTKGKGETPVDGRRRASSCHRLLGSESMAYCEQEWRCGERGDKGEFCLKTEHSSRQEDMWAWHSVEKGLGQEVQYLYLQEEKVIATGKAKHLERVRGAERGQKPPVRSHPGQGRKHQGSKGAVRGRETRPRRRGVPRLLEGRAYRFPLCISSLIRY